MPEDGGSLAVEDSSAIYPDAGEDAGLPGVSELVEREGRLPAAALEEGLRRHTARGTIINAAFQIGLAVLNFARRLVVAIFLTAAQFGIWGAILGTLFLVVFLKDAGFGDKFIQQSEADQEAAFQKLFTLELLLGAVTMVLAAVAMPIFGQIYGHPEIVAPGIVLSTAVLGSCLQAPNLIYYRQMDFVRQRTLQAVSPVVAFVVTVALCAAGASYWGLVIGAVVGSFAGAAVALVMCPYRIRLRFERQALRDYFHFSWPLVVASGEFIVIGQIALVLATRTSGIAAAGAIGLAVSITQLSQGVDNIVTQTAYPAICAVRDRIDLLFEVFVKSNRLALMWGFPFGVAIALFSADLVHFVLGDGWDDAIVVLAAFGVVAAIDQLGFNWTAFVRATGYTRPLASVALVDVIAFVLVTGPLLIAFGLPGFAAGSIVAEVARVSARTYFLARLFPRFQIVRQAGRAALPAVPAILVVLGARLLEPNPRTAAMALAELAAFAAITVAATVVFERSLLREIAGYLRRRPVPGPLSAAGSTQS